MSDSKILRKLEIIILIIVIISFFLYIFTEFLAFTLIIFYCIPGRFLITGIDKYLQKKMVQSAINVGLAVIFSYYIPIYTFLKYQYNLNEKDNRLRFLSIRINTIV